MDSGARGTAAHPGRGERADVYAATRRYPFADPIDHQAAVFVGCLLPREVTGVERMDLAVREKIIEVLVVLQESRERRAAGSLSIREAQSWPSSCARRH